MFKCEREMAPQHFLRNRSFRKRIWEIFFPLIAEGVVGAGVGGVGGGGGGPGKGKSQNMKTIHQIMFTFLGPKKFLLTKKIGKHIK